MGQFPFDVFFERSQFEFGIGVSGTTEVLQEDGEDSDKEREGGERSSDGRDGNGAYGVVVVPLLLLFVDVREGDYSSASNG